MYRISFLPIRYQDVTRSHDTLGSQRNQMLKHCLPSAHFNDMEQATGFMSACFGMKRTRDMSEARLQVWGKTNGKRYTSTSATDNRGIDRECKESLLPVNPVAKRGSQLTSIRSRGVWVEDRCRKQSLSPNTIPDGVKLAPIANWRWSGVAATARSHAIQGEAVAAQIF